jgi:cell division protein FtsL
MDTDGENPESSRANPPLRPSGMSFRRVLVLILLVAAVTTALIFYIKLQSDVTKTSREVADLEQQLTELKSQNDAAYNEINDSISLEEVREKAINELGMKSADRDQVVIYSGEEKDSVNQVGDPDDD